MKKRENLAAVAVQKELARGPRQRLVQVGRPVEMLWCSPPCTEFSDANPNAPLRPSLEERRRA